MVRNCIGSIVTVTIALCPVVSIIILGLHIVAKSCYLVCNINTATVASICGIACIHTSGCSNSCTVRVNVRCKTAIGLITYITNCLLCLSSSTTGVNIGIKLFITVSTLVPVVAFVVRPAILCYVADSHNNFLFNTIITNRTCSLLQAILSTSNGSNNRPITELVLVNCLCLEEIITVLTATAGLEVISGFATVSGNKVLLTLNSLIECVKVAVINNNLNRRSYRTLHRGNLYTTFLCSKGENSNTVCANEILNLTICKGKSKSGFIVSNVVATYSLIDGINSICPVKSGKIASSYTIPCDVGECYVANSCTGDKSTKCEGSVFRVSTLCDGEYELNLCIILICYEIIVR